MKLSREGAMELIGHEAIILTRYLDSVGVWTLGIGHTKMAGVPNPETYLGKLTIKDAHDLFLLDVQKYVAAVNAALKVKVTQTQFDALVSFHFNTGAIGRATLVRKLNASDIDGAAKGFDAWNKPPEIIERRTKERDLFAKGRYANNGMANIYPATPQGRVEWGKPKRIDLRSLVGGVTVPPPPDIPKPVKPPVPVPAPKSGSVAGPIVGTIAAGGAAATATHQAGYSTTTIIIAVAVVIALVIGGVVLFRKLKG